MASESIQLSSPQGVLSAVPRLIGFQPADSLVLLFLAERRLELTSRVDLSPAPSPVQVAELVRRVPTATAVMVALYERDLFGHRALVEQLLEQLPVPAVDVLTVAEGRWSSYLCAGSCCPREGVPLRVDSDVEAELVLRGMTAVASRAERSAMVAHVGGPLSAELAELSWQVQDVQVRDRLLAEGRPGLQDRLCAALRALPDHDPRTPRLAGTAAFLAYLNGDGALANMARERAGQDSLGLLVERAIQCAAPPSLLRQALVGAP